jgi:hypothetical protein
MKKVVMLIFAILLGQLVLASAPIITDVKATPISPWAVQIDYKVVGGDSKDPVLVASNTVTHQVCHASSGAIKGELKLTEGQHSVRWNLMKDYVNYGKSDVVFKILDGTYCVIDLSAGANASTYPVSYLSDIPSGGWKAEHKTTKLVLRLIEPGTFKMNGAYDVTLTKRYYIGIFEVTQKQYELVTGNSPSYNKGDLRPVENVSCNMIRGDSVIYNWPSVKTVDPDSFIGLIRSKTGLPLDLPTEAQWEYACRAGTTSNYNNGGNTEEDLKKLGRCWENLNDGRGGYKNGHTTVGSYTPNAWGLYDMHGNVWEMCLDWDSVLSSSVDPVGPESGTRRMRRGGEYSITGRGKCTSSYRDSIPPFSTGIFDTGFRLCCSAGL